MTSPEGEFKTGLVAALAEYGRFAEAQNTHDFWIGALTAVFAFRLPDQPEGPRVAVVGEQVGWQWVDDGIADGGLLPLDTTLRSDTRCKPVVTLYPDTPLAP